jgi:hypothetical protein
MDYYTFPSSNLITKFKEEHYCTMNYDQEKMSTSRNWYAYADMTNYMKLTQLLDEVRTFVTSPEFCKHFGPGDIKRIDRIETHFQDYRQYHRVTDGRLVWEKLSIIDKKILKVENKLGLNKENEDKGCQTLGEVVSIPKNCLAMHPELEPAREMMKKFDYLKQLCLLADSHYKIFKTAKTHFMSGNEERNISYLSAITVNLLLSIELGLKAIFAVGKNMQDDRRDLLQKIQKQRHNIAKIFDQIDEKYRRQIIEHVCSDLDFPEEWFFSRLESTSVDMISAKYFCEEILTSTYGTFQDRISDRFLHALAEVVNEITMQEIVKEIDIMMN